MASLTSDAVRVVATPHNMTGMEAHFHITHIIFDRDPSLHIEDGLNIRYTPSADLAHGSDGLGEWIKPDHPNAADTWRNEPAAYVGGVSHPIVLVRIAAFHEDPQHSHVSLDTDLGWGTFWAEPADATSGLPGLMPTTVEFANGYSYDSSSGSQYVPFMMTSAFPYRIDKIVDSWKWYGADLFHESGTEWTTPQVTEQVDTSGPHTIYTVLDVPGQTWYFAGDATTEPWVSALEFTVVTAGTQGKTSKSAAAKRVVQFAFDGNGHDYDYVNGAPGFIASAPGGSDPRVARFKFTNWMAGSAEVNCEDQACAVHTMK